MANNLLDCLFRTWSTLRKKKQELGKYSLGFQCDSKTCISGPYIKQHIFRYINCATCFCTIYYNLFTTETLYYVDTSESLVYV